MESLKCLFCNFPWAVFLFAALLGLLLWWLLSSLLASRFKTQSSELQDRINFLEGELEACRKAKISGSVSANVGTKSVASEVSSGIAGVTSAAGISSLMNNDNTKDNLQIVEGIGPKIEELFNNAGIFSFNQLANTAVNKLKEILEAGGARFQMHDPSTWPEQSAMARDGKWDELKKWQDELNKGKG